MQMNKIFFSLSSYFLRFMCMFFYLCCRSSRASTMKRGSTDIMNPYLRHLSQHCGQSLWPSSLWGGSLAPSPLVSLSIASEGKFKQKSFKYFICISFLIKYIFVADVSNKTFILFSSIFRIFAGGTRCSWLTC